MAVYASSEFSRVFSALDRDGDGKLSAAELRLCMKAALGEDVSAEEAERLVASADADGDGLLSQEELLALAGWSGRRSGCTPWKAKGASRR